MTYADYLKRRILELASKRGPQKSICPSEVARKVAASAGDGENWRDLMEPVRKAAIELAIDGSILILRKGRTVEPPFRGPIRLQITDGKTD